MPSQSQSSGPVTELARDMRLFDITMVGVGMIGAGIFASPASPPVMPDRLSWPSVSTAS